MKQEEQELSCESINQEIEGKLGQFHRVLMSYIDFQQAGAISAYVLEAKLHSEYPRKNRILLQALNSAMIVSYCRPFSGADRSEYKIPDLPSRFLKALTEKEREVHKIVMIDRNTIIAHSDQTAWQLEPLLLRIRDSEVLVPYHQDIHSPLTYEATTIFNGICNKLQEAVFEERCRLEPELRTYLRVVEIDDDAILRSNLNPQNL